MSVANQFDPLVWYSIFGPCAANYARMRSVNQANSRSSLSGGFRSGDS